VCGREKERGRPPRSRPQRGRDGKEGYGMGQYFRIVNLDKKEWIRPDGLKLWELCAGNSVRMLGYLLATNNWDGTSIAKLFFSKEQLDEIKKELESLGFGYEVYFVDEKNFRGYVVPKLKYFGRWCCDRIVVLGDYADESTNYKVGVTGPSYHELNENPEWKDITEEVEKEFNYFIQKDELKVKHPVFINNPTKKK
jgi:hypothetical protein